MPFQVQALPDPPHTPHGGLDARYPIRTKAFRAAQEGNGDMVHRWGEPEQSPPHHADNSNKIFGRALCPEAR